MRDSEVVASIVAGDPLGLAAAYDRYADPLFQYCRTLLGDAADAADAVQDTFVIAASRLDRLRDPSRLGPWLYAVARNEALRILRSKNRTSALEVTDLRALLEDASAGLLDPFLPLAEGAPEGLRAHTITLATGQGVVAVAHRAAVLSRAGAFTRSGFPQAASVRRALRSSPRRVATVTAAIVIAAIIATVAFALTGSSGTAPPAAATSAASAAATTSAAAPTSATTSASAAPSKTDHPATPAATTAAPTPTPTPTSAAPPPASAPGELSEYPAGGPLVLSANGQPGRQIDLSGSGTGDWQVTWSLAVANDPDDVISVSASAGTLTSADPTATVTVTANRFVPCGRRQSPTITVSPGGAVFSVCTGGFGHFTG